VFSVRDNSGARSDTAWRCRSRVAAGKLGLSGGFKVSVAEAATDALAQYQLRAFNGSGVAESLSRIVGRDAFIICRCRAWTARP
jgi:hypothetical protein